IAAKLTGFRSPRALLSAPPEELMRRFKMFDVHGRPFPFEALPGWKALMGEKPREVLIRFRAQGSGEDRWVTVRANALRDNRGAVRSVVSIFRDVTQERKHEEALGLANEWFRIALRSIGDAVITTDERG